MAGISGPTRAKQAELRAVPPPPVEPAQPRHAGIQAKVVPGRHTPPPLAPIGGKPSAQAKPLFPGVAPPPFAPLRGRAMPAQTKGARVVPPPVAALRAGASRSVTPPPFAPLRGRAPPAAPPLPAGGTTAQTKSVLVLGGSRLAGPGSERVSLTRNGTGEQRDLVDRHRIAAVVRAVSSGGGLMGSQGNHGAIQLMRETRSESKKRKREEARQNAGNTEGDIPTLQHQDTFYYQGSEISAGGGAVERDFQNRIQVFDSLDEKTKGRINKLSKKAAKIISEGGVLFLLDHEQSPYISLGIVNTRETARGATATATERSKCTFRMVGTVSDEGFTEIAGSSYKNRNLGRLWANHAEEDSHIAASALLTDEVKNSGRGANLTVKKYRWANQGPDRGAERGMRGVAEDLEKDEEIPVMVCLEFV